jgi:hypothetical protein
MEPPCYVTPEDGGLPKSAARVAVGALFFGKPAATVRIIILLCSIQNTVLYLCRALQNNTDVFI